MHGVGISFLVPQNRVKPIEVGKDRDMVAD